MHTDDSWVVVIVLRFGIGENVERKATSAQPRNVLLLHHSVLLLVVITDAFITLFFHCWKKMKVLRNN